MPIYNSYNNKTDAFFAILQKHAPTQATAKSTSELAELVIHENDTARAFWDSERKRLSEKQRDGVQSNSNISSEDFVKRIAGEIGARYIERRSESGVACKVKAVRNNRIRLCYWFDANGNTENISHKSFPSTDVKSRREEEWYGECEIALQERRRLITAVIDQAKSKGRGKNLNPDIIGIYLGDYEWSNNHKLNAFHEAIRWHTPADRPRAGIEAVEVKKDLKGKEDISIKLTQTERRTWWANVGILMIVDTEIDNDQDKEDDLRFLVDTAKRLSLGVLALNKTEQEESCRVLVEPIRREMDAKSWDYLLKYAEHNTDVMDLLERVGDDFLTAKNKARRI